MGLLLDGRNRFKACQEVGIQPLFREYKGDNPTAFVISLNLKRRHLNESQRAMVAAKLENMPAHRPADKCANLHTSRKEAAKLLNVGTRSVSSAKKVEEKGSPELVAAKLANTTRADAGRKGAESSHGLASANLHLPSSWRTLYELTKLDDQSFLTGLEAGHATVNNLTVDLPTEVIGKDGKKRSDAGIFLARRSYSDKPPGPAARRVFIVSSVDIVTTADNVNNKANPARAGTRDDNVITEA